MKAEDENIGSSPIFVGGAGRSGTTLVRVILDSHPNIVCGPELKVTVGVAQQWHLWNTGLYPALQEYLLDHDDITKLHRDLILKLLDRYRQQFPEKKRVAEKSPNNVYVFVLLHAMFPESPLVQVVRDGRDVVASLLQSNWIDPATGEPIDYTQDAAKAAHYWVNAVRAGRLVRQQEDGDKQYFEIRYEDIIKTPEQALIPLFEHIQEPWDPAVLSFYKKKHDLAGESSASQVSKPLYTKAIGRWQQDLSKEQLAIVTEIAGPLLEDLGYDVF